MASLASSKPIIAARKKAGLYGIARSENTKPIVARPKASRGRG